MRRETGARLHIVHVSYRPRRSAGGRGARRGANVSIETCPHYLFFTEEDVERIGAAAKCAPPLRPRGIRRRALAGACSGRHGADRRLGSLARRRLEMKTGDFWRAWGGIAGVQSTLPALLDHGHHERACALDESRR